MGKKHRQKKPRRAESLSEDAKPTAPSQKCDTLPWKFHVFVSANGTCDVEKWIDKLTEEATEEFRSRVRYLANTSKADWSRPEVAKLAGVKDIYEIRFKANGLQHRPLGFFGPGNGVFTILIWCTKKQSVYDPANAIRTSEDRADLFSAGATSRILKIDGEVFPEIEEEPEDQESIRQSGAYQRNIESD